MEQIKHRVVKFPENRRVNEKLEDGDRVIIAEKTKLSAGYIRDILLGFRRMTDPVAAAIVELLQSRNSLLKSLEEVTNN